MRNSDQPDPRSTELADALMEPEEKRSPEQAALDILSRLAIACKSRLLYSPDHPAVRDAVTVLHAVAEDALRSYPEIAVRVERERFTCNDVPLGEDRESLRRLASRMRDLNIRALVLSSGLNLGETGALVELVVSSPEDVEKQGGAEAFLLARGIHGIRVVESEAGKAGEETELGEEVREEAPAEEEAQAVVTEEDFESLMDLLFEPERLASVLSRLEDGEGGPLEGETLAAAMYDFLKNAWELVQRRAPERLPALSRSLAETLLFLEKDLRNSLLLRQALPRMREGPPAREMLARLSPPEASGVFGHLLPLAPQLIPRMDELLAAIGFRERELEETLLLLRERLIDLGEVPLSLVSTLEGVLAARGIRTPASALPSAEEISSLSEYYAESELQEIRAIAEMDMAQESYRVTTPMLLDLLQRGAELDSLGKVVDLLVDNFWGLVTSARFSDAAPILEAFERSLQRGDPALLPHREQLEALLEEASRKGIIQRMIQLASEHRGDRETVEGFKELMKRLGDRGLLAMIDALGSEESMAVRKFIIDALADLARDRVSLLGSFLEDPRWYLVRNIITVMARIRSPFTLPYLERAMSHPHPKVRSEAVRAIGLTGGYAAEDLLIKGLSHPDERIRIFCIRWLGRLEVIRAVPRLSAMLEEKEPGAEDHSVKKEILESLGRIGDPSAYDLLRRHAGRQRGLFRSDWQELADTAREAMRKLEERHPHLARKK